MLALRNSPGLPMHIPPCDEGRPIQIVPIPVTRNQKLSRSEQPASRGSIETRSGLRSTLELYLLQMYWLGILEPFPGGLYTIGLHIRMLPGSTWGLEMVGDRLS